MSRPTSLTRSTSSKSLSEKGKSLADLFLNTKYEYCFSVIIVLDLIELGLLTLDLSSEYIFIFNIFDLVVELIFLSECVIKIYIFRFGYFLNGWFVLDLVITILTIAPLGELSNYSRIARCIRVLRAIRAISHLSELRYLINVIGNSIRRVYSSFILCIFIIYLYAIIGTLIYGVVFDEWFGSLWKSMYTLFQIMTLEAWSDGIARSVMADFPSSWVYFISYVIISAIIMYNITVGIIVETVEETREHREKMEHNRKKTIRSHGFDEYIHFILNEQRKKFDVFLSYTLSDKSSEISYFNRDSRRYSLKFS